MDLRPLIQSPPSPQETSSSSETAPAQHKPLPSQPASPPPRSAPNVQTLGATPTGDRTISHEPPAQDHTPNSTGPTTSAPPLPPGALAGSRPSTFWRFILAPRNPTLPVTNAQPVRQTIFRQLKQWHESRQEHLLPEGVIQVRIAVSGFAFYGIVALLGNTCDLIKEFSENSKVLILFLIGFIWTVATIAVPLTMSARTRLCKALSHHATRLVLLGITLHMLFNISLMLPRNVWVTSKINIWSLVAFVFLSVLAIIGHVASWIQSSLYGEVEEKPTEESVNNIASS